MFCEPAKYGKALDDILKMNKIMRHLPPLSNRFIVQITENLFSTLPQTAYCTFLTAIICVYKDNEQSKGAELQEV